MSDSVLDRHALNISILSSARSNDVRNVSMTWGELTEKLSNTIHTEETEKEYSGFSRTEQARIKDIGGFVAGHFKNSKRKAINLKGRSCITLDVDFSDDTFPARVKAKFKKAAFLYHTTHSNNEKQKKYRLIIPLREEIEKDKYVPIARKLADILNMEWVDKTCFRVSQLMYWASTPKDGDYEFYKNDAVFIDPEKVLGMYDDWRDVSEWPLHSSEENIRLSLEKAEDPLSKKGIIGAFCRAYSVSEAIEKFLPEIYTPADEGRYTYYASSTANGAILYEDKFLYSHHETDPCCSTLVNAFDLVRIHLFKSLDVKAAKGLTVTQLPSYKAVCEELREDEEVKALLVEDQIQNFDDLDAAINEAEMFADLSDDEDDENENDEDVKQIKGKWYKNLSINNRNQIESSLTNIRLIFEHDPVLVHTVKYNNFNQDVVQVGNLPEYPLNRSNHSFRVSERLWGDIQEVKVRYYLEKNYNMEVSDKKVEDVVKLVADVNGFHPVLDYLEGLEWDGKERVERMCIDYLGCSDNAYVRAVSRKVMAAAVARVFDPGCKFDYLLILEGMQGKRKSTFIEVLARGWFTDTLGDIKNKDAVENMRGKWIIEAAELATVSVAEEEHKKAFFSRRTDRMREAYGRKSKDYPRQCIFIGSTNPDGSGYLKDITGNRRYWPIECNIKEIPIERLEDNIDQLWAEAVQLYFSNEPLWLTGDAKEIAESEQQLRRPDNELTGIIRAWADKPISEQHYTLDRAGRVSILLEDGEEGVTRDRICIMSIWEECLGNDLVKLSPGKRKEIQRAVHDLPEWNSKETKRRLVGKELGRQRCYLRYT
jgi:putative DNA primase/helicase